VIRVWVRVWHEDIWGVGTEEIRIPAPDHGEEVGDIAGHER